MTTQQQREYTEAKTTLLVFAFGCIFGFLFGVIGSLIVVIILK